MLDFFYDSLETVKKLKHPTRKDFINITLSIFALVIIAGFYFVTVDTVVGSFYKQFYAMMTGK